MGIDNLRVDQNINQPFRILKYIIIIRWIVRLRTEHWLLTVRSVDRCAPSTAIAPDHNAIPPVVLLLRSQCLSLCQPDTIARQAFTFVSMQRGRAAAPHRMPIVVDRLGGVAGKYQPSGPTVGQLRWRHHQHDHDSQPQDENDARRHRQPPSVR